jgi:hypothetical protein
MSGISRGEAHHYDLDLPGNRLCARAAVPASNLPSPFSLSFEVFVYFNPRKLTPLFMLPVPAMGMVKDLV